MKDKDEAPNTRRFSLFAKSLSDTLAFTLKPVYKKHGFAEHRILTEWHMIIGSELAAASLPQKLTLRRGAKEGGTLYVLVNSARALELQHMQPLILERIATYFGYAAVSRLVFTQTSSALFRKPAGATVKPEPSGINDFSALAARCKDESLRRALEGLAQALAAVEK